MPEALAEGTSPLAVDELAFIRSICRESFVDFIREFWPEVPGAGGLIWNWHMDVIAGELQELAERVFLGLAKDHDTVINVPPGTSKTTICLILFPPWTWTRMPQARHITASHTDKLALDAATKSRYVVNSDKYRACFPEIALRHDQDTKGYYANTLGGDRLTCTVAGKSPIGFHAHFISVDDPLDPKRAISEAELKTAKDFFDAVLPSRKVDKEVTPTVLIMQRLHEDDPSGHMLAKGKREGAAKVRHICLPAERAANVNPPELAERYVDGLLDPVRLSRIVIRERMADGIYSFNGQYMQNPVPLGGGMFKSHWFSKVVRAAPYDCRRVRYWDRAASQDKGCNTVGTLVSMDKEGNFYVGPVEVGQWEPDERDRVIVATARRDRDRFGPRHEPDVVVEHEPGSSGVDAYKHTARRLAGFRVFPDRPSGRKEVRAEPWASQAAAGNVYVVDDGTWDVDAWIKEHCAFPFGKLLDRVDSATGGFLWLVNRKRKEGSASFRVLTPAPRHKLGEFRVWVVGPDDVTSIPTVEKGLLLVSVGDPGSELPAPVFTPLDSIHLRFLGIEPVDFQADWGTTMQPWDELPERLCLQRQQAAELWAFLLRNQRERDVRGVVFQDQGGEDRRALALAYAVADGNGWRRFLWRPADPEADHAKATNPIKFVADVMRAARGSCV